MDALAQVAEFGDRPPHYNVAKNIRHTFNLRLGMSDARILKSAKNFLQAARRSRQQRSQRKETQEIAALTFARIESILHGVRELP
jgi:hypothetical protein